MGNERKAGRMWKEAEFRKGSGRVKDKEAIEHCRKLYFRYKGADHSRIEREMREAGFSTFSRRNIQTSFRKDGTIARRGWAQRFDWDKDLQRLRRNAETARARRTKDFESWLRRNGDGMNWTEPFHAYICRQLGRVTDGEVKRMMLFVPPRHGKSELATVRYAAWRLTRDPRLNIIIGSYNQRLANRFSRKILKIMARAGRLAKAHQAADEWETVSGGGVKAVGVGAGITGFGGGLVIIDDPVKNRAQANSRVLRERTWDWYKDDIHTRLEPDGAVILIQTRWHDDDLAGRLLLDMKDGGEHWEVVRFPALAEGEGETADLLGRDEGAALWPERFGREALLATRRRLGSRSFAALYQQRPQPEGGALFRAEWFSRRVAKHPPGLKWYRGYDLAVSVKDSADHTASFRVALDLSDGTLYLADGFRRRLEYPDQRRFVLERMAEESDTIHCIESAMHGTALLQDLRRDARAAGRVLRAVKPEGDKLMRAEAWAPLAEEGRIVLVNGPWIGEFIDEACRFTGKGDAHDDQVDAVSIAVQSMRSRNNFNAF